MDQHKETKTIKCKKCDYEFLVPNQDLCPRCGSKLNHLEIGLSWGAIGTPSAPYAMKQKEQTTEKKIVNWPLKIILVIILIGSPILGLFLANIPGAIIGLLIDVVAWYLEKFAEKRYVEKTIERDHYH